LNFSEISESVVKTSDPESTTWVKWITMSQKASTRMTKQKAPHARRAMVGADRKLTRRGNYNERGGSGFRKRAVSAGRAAAEMLSRS
jgi:hypothetical protein